MSLLIVCVSIILICCSEVNLKQADTNYTKITFRFQEKYGTDFIVQKDQRLDIILDNFCAQYAWCLKLYYSDPDDVFINHTKFDGRSDSTMTVPKVNDKMISRWWCVVLQEYSDGKPYIYLGHNYTAQNIVFRLRANDSTSSNMELIYIISGIVVTILLVFIIILIKYCCCKQSNHKPLQHLPIDPDSVFYLNLEIFRQQYERELRAQEESHYEEID